MRTGEDWRTDNAWTAWLIVIVLFTAFTITMSVNAVIGPRETLGTLDLAQMGVGAIAAGVDFQSGEG